MPIESPNKQRSKIDVMLDDKLKDGIKIAFNI